MKFYFVIFLYFDIFIIDIIDVMKHKKIYVNAGVT